MAALFILSWSEPGSPWAASAAECRRILLLEGLGIAATALVGGYRAVAQTFFPLVMLGLLAWFVHSATGPLSWALISFAWYVVAAFVNGVQAHRGRFGNARTNPAHPYRRLDRMFFIYVAVVPIFILFRVASYLLRWPACGAIYFTMLFVVDTGGSELFDRIPQGLLRRMREGTRESAEKDLGLCFDCVHVQPAIPAEPPRRLVRCQLSLTDPLFPEFPETPVRLCAGFRKRDQPK